MQQAAAIQVFLHHGDGCSPVWLKRDIAKLFPKESKHVFNASLTRLVRSGILIRAIKGVYVNALSRMQDAHMIEHVAKAMRRGHHSYVSLESALSEYSVIPQLPMRLTVMTTGPKGIYSTHFGTIEFVHTKRAIQDVLKGSVDVGRPLRLARKETAYRDLKRVGRNLDLIDHGVLHGDE